MDLIGNAGRFISGIFSTVVTLLGLALLTFFIGRVMPIDPVLAIVGDRASPAAVAQARLQLGLDKPLFEQFWIYLTRLVHGDLGHSLMTGETVTADVLKFFPATFELATSGMVLALLFGIPLGVLAAARQNSRFDKFVRIASLAGQSLPVFVLALICLQLFYVTLDVAPGTGQQDVLFQGMVPAKTGMLVIDAALDGQWDAFWDAVWHLAMPALLLGYINLSVITRMTRTLMVEGLSGEFIVTAKAKGLPAGRVLWGHGFRVVSGRLAVVVALTYAGLLEGTVLTETVFSWPGIGLYLTHSLLNADMNAVLGVTLVIGLVYICLNLLSGMVQRMLDPRIK